MTVSLYRADGRTGLIGEASECERMNTCIEFKQLQQANMQQWMDQGSQEQR